MMMRKEGGMEMEEKNNESGSLVQRMVLRVLLVEADDCTRQIIAALLRKCSYRVAAVPDGLKAWETLKGRPHNIDLVLTEVELPLISGYALLTLIVEHDMCKNIPVIMMSSKDSISTVLKCMVKGAADFLIKPVRKNELKNLWQHVWRRKTQNAGNCPQSKVPKNEKFVAVSEDDVESNYASDNMGSIQRGDGTHASDAQGVTHIRCKDAFSKHNDEMHEECVEVVEKSFMPNSKPANFTSSGMGTTTDTGPCSSVAINLETTLCAEPRAMATEVQQRYHSENTFIVDEVDCRLNEFYSAPCTEAFDLIGKFGNCLADSEGYSYKSKEKSNPIPRLELSLRILNPSCSNNEGSREQNTINHSNASAFSKYENKKTSEPLSSGLSSNSAALREGSSASTWEHDASMTGSQQKTTALAMNQQRYCEAAIQGTQLSFIPVDRVRLGTLGFSYTHMYPSMFNTQSDCHQVQSPKAQPPGATSSSTYSTSEVQILEQGLRSFDDTGVHSEDNKAEADNEMSETVENTKHDSTTSGSSNLGSGVTNKLSSSRCDSISNEAIESSMPVASSERAPVCESVDYNDIFHDRTRTENHSTSQREAALMKFRLKRKDRCYEKKVRYQSRKRLAEQRPRVKGQFVRLLQSETLAFEAQR